MNKHTGGMLGIERAAWKQGALFGVEAMARVAENPEYSGEVDDDLDNAGHIEALAWKRLLDQAGVPPARDTDA